MASNGYGAIALTGGGAGALDAINGSILNDGDAATVYDYTNQRFYHYKLDASSGAAESSPDIIAPDTNPGTKRWLLLKYYNNAYMAAFLDNSTAATAVADLGILALNNIFTAGQFSNASALTDGATALDYETDMYSTLLLEENTTLGDPSNKPAGDEAGILIKVTQDGTGAWTLSFNAAIDFSDHDSAVNTDANAVTWYFIWTDGTDNYARKLWVSN